MVYTNKVAAGGGREQTPVVAVYVAFLRAINLGPRRQFPMADLRAALEADGFVEPRTHIQTGNVRLETPMRSVARLTERLERVFAADRGFEVPTAVLTRTELVEAATDGEAFLALETAAGEVHGQYVTFLRDLPEPTAVDALEALSDVDGRVRVRGRAVHLTLSAGYQSTRLDNNRVEKVLGVAGTNRNLTVVRRLAADWGR